jgi:hypothetical protein
MRRHAVSSSRDKEAHARQLGASHFIATRGTDELRKAARSFDVIFCTVPSDLPWDEYMAALRPQGKLCLMGIPDKPVVFRAFGLIGGEKAIVGGQTGSVSDTAEMLAFTARHGITPNHRSLCDVRRRPGAGTHPGRQGSLPRRPCGLSVGRPAGRQADRDPGDWTPTVSEEVASRFNACATTHDAVLAIEHTSAAAVGCRWR